MALTASSRTTEWTGCTFPWCSSPVPSAAGAVLLEVVWHVLADMHSSRLSPAKVWVRAAVALVDAADSSSPPQHGACFFSTLEGCDKPSQGALNHFRGRCIKAKECYYSSERSKCCLAVCVTSALTGWGCGETATKTLLLVLMETVKTGIWCNFMCGY